jgi:four helix bundle protein
MASNFVDLAAYQRAVALAADVHSAVVRWPAFDRSTIGMQLLRSIDAVGANIAEASGRWTKTDRRRALIVARGELHEAEHWLRTARQRGVVDWDASDRIASIARPLNGLITKPTPD